MKYYKKFEYNMWHIHAFETDGSQDAYISKDMTPISETEADEIRAQPPSPEYQKKIAEGIEALGGRNGARYPPKEFKEAIGHICVNSAHHEVTLRTVVWLVSGLDSETGMAFTGNARYSDLLDTLKALVELRVPLLMTETRELCGRIKGLYAERAKYVHRLWMVGPDKQPIVTKAFLERSFAKSDDQQVSLEKMYDLAESFLNIEGELNSKIFAPLLKGHNISPHKKK
ncbi:MAG: hypothetical protein KGI97_04260 [Alphaproteobacteria bacterium]|nr:hypothetical protein [Alphaproteobacteria bacterium]